MTNLNALREQDNASELIELQKVRVFAQVTEDGTLNLERGIVLAAGSHVYAIQVEAVQDYGQFIRSLSSVSFLEHCEEVWNECFD